MFYMPGTKMLFGDAKDTCDGKWFFSSRLVKLAHYQIEISYQARPRGTVREVNR